MLKKFLIGTFAVAALALALTVSAAYDFGSTTLRVGSKGAAVMAVQTVVGASVDGSYGPMTAAAVKAWQASNGLAADGVFGPASMAKANAGSTVVTTPGCPAGAMFNSMTGASCTTVSTTLPAGCSSTAGFSSTTGAKCDGSTTPSTDNGPLVGGAGDITVTDFTSGTEGTVLEGQSEKVLGVYVEADNGSDISVSSMKVTLDTNAGSGSTRVERYIDSVDVYMGSTKVGSVDATELNKDATGEYSKSIALSNAVVRKGDKTKFYVEVKANSAIDSTDTYTWNVDVTSVRFQDAMGVVMTNDLTTEVGAQVVTFDDSTTNDEITSLSSSSNPDASTLLVKDTGVSDEYLVFAYKLKAASDSSDLNVLEIPITADPTGAGIDADEVVDDIYLKVGSTVYDNYDYAAGVYTFTIDEGDFEITAGSTVEVKVYAKFMEEGLVTTYDTGESVTFSLDASTMVVENTDGDSVSTASVTDRTGELLTLSTSAATISNYSWVANSTGTILDFFFTVDNSDGTDAFDVVTADVNDALASGSTGTIRTDSNVYETDIAGVVTWYSGDSVTPTASTKYTVEAGDTATFRVRYSLGATATTAVTATQNGQWVEVVVSSIAGETVPEAKQHSTTTTVSL